MGSSARSNSSRDTMPSPSASRKRARARTSAGRALLTSHRIPPASSAGVRMPSRSWSIASKASYGESPRLASACATRASVACASTRAADVSSPAVPSSSVNSGASGVRSQPRRLRRRQARTVSHHNRRSLAVLVRPRWSNRTALLVGSSSMSTNWRAAAARRYCLGDAPTTKVDVVPRTDVGDTPVVSRSSLQRATARSRNGATSPSWCDKARSASASARVTTIK
mmetsp:Transcript_3216/g.9969  ORF Transcript_3216/g.9969 Transcript_3216/m.9969 type:complete len:225 (-) Transcript_3216:2653-3327(-)